jgi:hypothetical protein
MASADLPIGHAATPTSGIAERLWRIRGLLAGTGVGLVTLTVGLRLARFSLDSYDAIIMFAVARSIATTRTTYVSPAVDFYGGNTPHATYGLGQSLVEAVGYLAAVYSGHRPESFAMLANPVLFAAVAVAIWGWARAALATDIQAAGVALATSFGTVLLAYTVTGFSEMGTALGIAVAILGVELAGRRPFVGAAVAGAGVGIAVLWRPDSALLVAVPVVVAIALRNWRGLPAFVLATAPVAIVTLIYNGGNGAQYEHMPLSGLFTYSLARGAYGLVLSPGRGLLPFVPLVVPALAAVPWAWRRSWVVTALCLVLLVIRVPFYARLADAGWVGGWNWGPRYLVPAMPCLAPLLYEIVRRVSWRRWPLAAAAGLVLAVSITFQVAGTAVRYDVDTLNQTWTVAVGKAGFSGADQVMFDWRYFPVPEHLRWLRHGRNLASGYKGGVGLPYN